MPVARRRIRGRPRALNTGDEFWIAGTLRRGGNPRRRAGTCAGCVYEPIWMRFGSAFGCFGTVSVSTPFFSVAFTASLSTVSGNTNRRWK